MTKAKGAPEAQTWSDKTPGLQLAWDATSLQSFMSCAARYDMEIRRGYRLKGNTVHIDWGHFLHGSLEAFDHALLAGMDKEDAMYEALDWALKATGQELWKHKTKGTLRNELDKSHDPEEWERLWVPWGSEDEKKTRQTLIRAIVWFADEQAGNVQPYAFPDGTPAIELSFRIPLPTRSAKGEPFLLCGHLDGMALLGDELFIRERKTTKTTIGAYYWERYSPNVQVDTYDLAGWLLFPDLKISGVMMEAIQTAVEFTRVARQPLYHTKARREEWLKRVLEIIAEAEKCAENSYWPMNTAACNLNGGCPYQRVCRADPSQRERILIQTGEYEVRKWDPLKVR
jgi:hypothetical protein